MTINREKEQEIINEIIKYSKYEYIMATGKLIDELRKLYHDEIKKLNKRIENIKNGESTAL